MIRYHIVAGYLCCEAIQSKFQKRFNDQACMSSLTMLFGCFRGMLAQNSNSVPDHQHQLKRKVDEFLCYAALRHLCSVVCDDAGNGGSTTRSTDDLLQTVRHVVYNIFCRRRLAGKFDFRQHNHTLCVVSGFASDRLRGVSVDVVQNQYANAAVQTLEDLERTFEILR